MKLSPTTIRWSPAAAWPCGLHFRMMRRLPQLFAVGAWIVWTFAATASKGEPLMVRKVFGQASARGNTVLSPGQSFSTGAGSKSELGIAGSIVRIGERAEVRTLAGGIGLTRGV